MAAEPPTGVLLYLKAPTGPKFDTRVVRKKDLPASYGQVPLPESIHVPIRGLTLVEYLGNIYGTLHKIVPKVECVADGQCVVFSNCERLFVSHGGVCGQGRCKPLAN